ncbi:uncharacterized protein LOC111096677 isoform X1 [Canis lupus familiaris]|uniref:uncharacterized protein LOC111096677 isoform X1 n=1 Tax=Canis lupus familiaris TaxID=9615 RepID=UPI0018F685B4|nr:uncharacterized protein LOC111096677 isoform X1 [Canis lupus familiaris]XP_038527409.1 uncharacterized protein LOC111096677 isoform X1 [Canis lupus familiaris]
MPRWLSQVTTLRRIWQGFSSPLLAGALWWSSAHRQPVKLERSMGQCPATFLEATSDTKMDRRPHSRVSAGPAAPPPQQVRS